MNRRGSLDIRSMRSGRSKCGRRRKETLFDPFLCVTALIRVCQQTEGWEYKASSPQPCPPKEEREPRHSKFVGFHAARVAEFEVSLRRLLHSQISIVRPGTGTG